MTKAIIFDCFGVLTTEGWLPFKEQHFGHDKALAQQASDLNQQANMGLISHEEFVSKVAGLAGISAQAVRAAIDVNVANEQLFHYIAESLKPTYEIGFLSNAASDWLKSLFSPEQIALFDVISLSFQEGVVKPQAEIYQKIAGQLKMKVDECILIDDQERHCAGARRAGMQAILYKDFEQMKGELERLLAADAKS